MKKQLREWGIFLALGLFLYFTGLYTDVAALAQRAILSTGLITADTKLENPEKADFNFTLQALDGQTVKFEDFKGKVIFLNVWATWCAPCIAEMPGIQDLYNKIDNKDIVFVMLSMDDSIEKPKRFIAKKEYTFPVYLPASRVPDVFRSPSIPTTYVISKDGKIVAKKVGMANYDTKSFRKFLNKQASKVSK
ncbi:TlpA family protein disulfide reductase [Fulvivirga ulvae]|uniref:TlpA family protein disulfide reductase n=1 Tax=Fulvivirga ulvae TaxID=2904245 RepID=UPI001F3EBAFC|nr:TlpA disulfide reductase family protein [Fulvivirga ulvae]UII30570.1 TlpA family protein disulfide reductase [Fulvivirga ulvae]